MARYTGATCRISRRYGHDLEFKVRDIESKCKLTTPPGQHGQRKRRVTEYGTQLAAKQMLRLKYGYFHGLYKRAARQSGVTGICILQMLELRLDNVVYRMGFASTRREARQLVAHRAILVNGKITNIPSYQLSPGDVVSIRPRAQLQERILDSMKSAAERGFPEWLAVNAKDFSGEVRRVPDKDDLPSDIDVSLVVEFYSK
jgi:small subunit ribosomal protein S4